MFIAWMVAFMVSQAPAGHPTTVLNAKETKEEALIRYESIARDVASVVSEEEPLFKGATGRIQTASVILSIMAYESSFRRDVDLGVGKFAKGDNGKSVCLMQLNVGQSRTYAWNAKLNRLAAPTDAAEDVLEGWTAQELLADRKKCVRAGYRMVRMSFSAGSGMPVTERLRVYASGSIGGGSKESRSRMGLALRYYVEHKPSFDDHDFLSGTPAVTPAKGVEPSWVEDHGPFRWTRYPFIRSIVLPGSY